MYIWKTWFHLEGPSAPGAPHLTTVQMHRYRHAGWTIRPSAIPGSWRWFLIISGSMRFGSEGDPPCRLAPGDSLCFPRDRPPSVRIDRDGDPVTFLYADFDPGALLPVFTVVARDGSPITVPVSHPAVVRLRRHEVSYRRMVRSNRSRSAATAMARVDPAESLRRVADLLALLMEQGMERRPPLVKAAIELVDQSGRYDLSATEIAGMLQVSRKHLTEMFSAAGMPTPGDWLLQRRLDHASMLLAEGRGVAEVARLVGYANPSSLSRVIRRRTGKAPRRN